jgi:hypothetical protein
MELDSGSSDLDSFLGKHGNTSNSDTSDLDSFLSRQLSPASSQKPQTTLADRAKDVAITGLKSAIGVPEAALGLVDIVTAGKAGKLAEQVGFRPKEAKAFLDEQYSPAQQAANTAVRQADGFIPSLKAYAQNPSVIAHDAGEQILPMLGGGVISQGVRKLAPKVAPYIAGAIGEGALTAGQNIEQVRQETPGGELDFTKQVLPVAASGVLTGAIAAGSGKIADKLGITDVQSVLAGGDVSRTGGLKNIAGTIALEGAGQELPQSIQEQAAQNYAMDRPITEGVGSAAAQGLVLGSAIGAGGAITQGPLSRAANTAQQTGVANAQATDVSDLSADGAATQGTTGPSGPEMGGSGAGVETVNPGVAEERAGNVINPEGGNDDQQAINRIGQSDSGLGADPDIATGGRGNVPHDANLRSNDVAVDVAPLSHEQVNLADQLTDPEAKRQTAKQRIESALGDPDLTDKARQTLQNDLKLLGAASDKALDKTIENIGKRAEKNGVVLPEILPEGVNNERVQEGIDPLRGNQDQGISAESGRIRTEGGRGNASIENADLQPRILSEYGAIQLFGERNNLADDVIGPHASVSNYQKTNPGANQNLEVELVDGSKFRLSEFGNFLPNNEMLLADGSLLDQSIIANIRDTRNGNTVFNKAEGVENGVNQGEVNRPMGARNTTGFAQQSNQSSDEFDRQDSSITGQEPVNRQFPDSAIQQGGVDAKILQAQQDSQRAQGATGLREGNQDISGSSGRLQQAMQADNRVDDIGRKLSSGVVDAKVQANTGTDESLREERIQAGTGNILRDQQDLAGLQTTRPPLADNLTTTEREENVRKQEGFTDSRTGTDQKDRLFDQRDGDAEAPVRAGDMQSSSTILADGRKTDARDTLEESNGNGVLDRLPRASTESTTTTGLTDEREDANSETRQAPNQKGPLLTFAPTHELADGTAVRQEEDGSFADRDNVSYTPDNESRLLKPAEIEAYREQETQAQSQEAENGAGLPAGGIAGRSSATPDGRVSGIPGGLPQRDQSAVDDNLLSSRRGVDALDVQDNALAQAENKQVPIPEDRSRSIAQTGVGQGEVSAQNMAEPGADAKAQRQTGQESKQPWQMTRDHYFNDPAKVRSDAEINNHPRRTEQKIAKGGKAIKNVPLPYDNQELFDFGTSYHKAQVKQALAEGKPVSPEVLKDYPDLQNESTPPNNQPPSAQSPAQDANTDSAQPVIPPAQEKLAGTLAGPVTPTVAKSGKPFSSAEVAQKALKSSAYPETVATHEVVPVDGGFGLAPKINIPAKPLQESSNRAGFSNPQETNVEASPSTSAQTPQESGAQPSPILTQSKKPYLLDQKRAYLKANPKAIQSAKDKAFADMESAYEDDLLKAEVQLPFESYRQRNPKMTDSLARQTYANLRSSFDLPVQNNDVFINNEQAKKMNTDSTQLATEQKDAITLAGRETILKSAQKKQQSADDVYFMDKYAPYSVVRDEVKKAVDTGAVRNNAAQFNLEFNIPFDVADRIHAEIAQPLAPTPVKTPEVESDQKDAVAETVASISENAEQPAPKSPESTPVADDVSKKGEKVDTKFSIAGVNAISADKGQLKKAINLHEQHRGAESIWRETGWYKGEDGKWRFEIDDSQAKLNDNFLNNYESITSSVMRDKEVNEKLLKEVFDHEKLYEAYPGIDDLAVNFIPREEGYDFGGSADIRHGIINVVVDQHLTPDNLESILLHEIQHMVQAKEQFANGGDQSQQTVDYVLRYLREEANKKFNGPALREYNRLADDLGELYRIQQWDNLVDYAHRDSITRNSKLLYQSSQYQKHYREVWDDVGYPPKKRQTDKHRSWLQETSLYLAKKMEEDNAGIPYRERLKQLKEAGGENALKNNIARVERRLDKTRPVVRAWEAAGEKLKAAEQVSKTGRSQYFTTDAKHDFYMSLAGEIEARMVEKRRKFTPEERAEFLPLRSEDKYRDTKIVSPPSGLTPFKADTTAGSTVAELTAKLDAADKKLLQSERLNIVQKVSDVPDSAISVDANGIEGFYLKSKVYIVADNVTPESLQSVLRHEYLHSALAENPKLKERLLGAQSELRDIFAQVEAGKYAGRYKTLYDEALRRVNRAQTSDADRFEEWLAYQVTQHHKSPQSLPERLAKAIANLVSTIKAAIFRYSGVPVGRLSPADLSALAKTAVSYSEIPDNSISPNTGNISPNSDNIKASQSTLPDKIMIDGNDRWTVNSEGKPIHTTEEGILNFWKWFKDSRVVDEQGRPLVVYHGTRREFFTFEPMRTFKAFGNSEKYKEAVYLTSDKREAEEYAMDQDGGRDDRSRIIKAYVAINSDNDGFIKKVSGQDEIEVIVLKSEHIKSIDNTGSFSASNPDIRYSLADDVREFKQRAGLGPKKTLVQTVQDILNRGIDANVQSLKDRWAELKPQLEQGVFDKFLGIKLAEKEILGDVAHSLSGYIGARLSTGSSSTMSAVLQYGAPEWKDGIIQRKANSKGLAEILQPVKSDLENFAAWMVARRADRLFQEGKENNFTRDMIDAGLSLAKPEYQGVADGIAELNKSILDLAEQAGLIDPQSRSLWESSDYIPFYRLIEEQKTTGPRNKKGLSHQSSGIRLLKGGENPLSDPLGNMMQNWAHLIDASMKNSALDKTLTNLTGSRFVTSIPRAEFKQALIPKEQIKKLMLESGLPQQIVDAMPKEITQGIAKMWAMQAPTDPDVVRVMREGKSEYFRVEDPMLLTSLAAVNQSPLPGIFKPMRYMKSLLTSAVTADPTFMARNFIRDSMHSWTIAEEKGFKLGMDSIQGAVKSFKEEGGFIDMMFAGASFQGGYGNYNNPDAARKSMDAALRKKGISNPQGFIDSIVDTPKKYWEMYRSIGDAIENANREATLENAKRAGAEKAQYLFEAKDLMDFSMQGSFTLVRAMSDMLPFFNARLIGLYRLMQAGKTDEARRMIMMKGASIAMFSLALLALNSDNDDYEALEDFDKDQYFHIFAGDQHFRIPKPFELGLIFGTIPERAARALVGKDSLKEFAARMGHGASDTLAFNPVPQMFRPFIELYANKDMFTGRPIENMSDEGKLASARYNEYTSETMRTLSSVLPEALGASPKRLEHLMHGYTGAMGMYILGASDSLVRVMSGMPESPSMRMDRLPVLKAFYQEKPAMHTVYGTQFYDMLRKTEQIQRTINAYKKEGQFEKARELQVENADKLSVRKSLNKTNDKLSDVRKQIDAIYRSELSPEQKRSRIDSLMTKQNNTVQAIVKRTHKFFN